MGESKSSPPGAGPGFSDLFVGRSGELLDRSVRSMLDAIMDVAHEGVFVRTLEGTILGWSRGAVETYGYGRDEAMNRNAGDLLGTEWHLPRAQVHEELVARGTWEGECGRTRADGVAIVVAIRLAVHHDARGRLVVIESGRNVSAEEALRENLVESQQRFGIAFDASPLAKIFVRVRGRILVEANPAFCKLVGGSRDAMVGHKLEDVAPAFPVLGSETFRRALVDPDGTGHLGFSFSSQAGVARDAEATAERMVMRGVEHVFVRIEDVSERLAAERGLRESEERFRQLAETIREVFWLNSASLDVVEYVSPAYEQIWGQSREGLYADPRDWQAAIHHEDRARVRQSFLAIASGGYDVEYRIVRPEGDMRWIHDRGFPVRDASGTVIRYAGVAEDITERRDLESQLRQTQKMESVGILAGGIAHDFNNLLTAIVANGEILEAILPQEQSEERELVAEMRLACERATSLTRQLLAFSRREVIDRRVVSLDSIVHDTERMLRRTLGEDMVLEIVTSREPTPVYVDPGSWVQVVLNLVVNARDSMPGGGMLTVGTRRVRLPEGEFVVLSVADTGAGMTQDVIARIYEPFFTTKEVGRGTGLGLAVVHGIVTGSGGHIEVESKVGKGTTFRVYVPVAPAPSSAPAPLPEHVEHPGTETILLVEDEDGIRKVCVRVLERAGYVVHEAVNGEDALALVARIGGPIDLLLTDVVMPHMGGRMLAEALGKRFPKMRVLYTSGYTDDAVVRHGVRHAEVAFLPKPFTIDELRRRVREVLDAD